LKEVICYTDGSCYLNDRGRGGYGAILQYGNVVKEICAGYIHTTNNRMELAGVIAALEELTEPCKVLIYSDSRYVTEAINKHWIKNWLKKDFKGIKNPDLWKKLVPLLEFHEVSFEWVKSHNGNNGNERADELASKGAGLSELIKDNNFT
jgi:ribonuclease HI